ncbi:MAG: glycosyltransferase family 87 protein [Pseudomonadota bacterium]
MLSKTVDRVVALAALIAVAAYFKHISDFYMPTRWAADLQYWWVAGQLWWSGLTPYDDANWLLGREQFPNSFEHPFFYPPSTVPFLGVFALAEPAMASRLLLIFNLCMVLAAAVFLALGAPRPMHLRTPLRFALLAVLMGVGFFPTLVATAFGGFQFVLLAGLLLWIAGARGGLAVPQAVGLILLMMKPQFGAPLALYCLIVPQFRLGAVIAGAGVGALFLIGGNGTGLVDLVSAWLSNVADYARYDVNRPERGAGLGWILGTLGYEPGVVGTAAPLLLVSAAIAVFSPLREPMTVSILIMILACFFWAGHQSDFVVFAPLFAVLFWRGDLKARLVLALALVPLSRGYEITAMMGGDAAEGALETLAGLQTLGLLLAFAVVLRLSFRVRRVDEEPLSGRRLKRPQAAA